MIKKLIEKYKAKKERKRYDVGFDWVMNAFYVGKVPTYKIRACVKRDNDPFSKGARDAINIIAWS